MEGDPEMIKQVFLNIILNAQQAMPDGGTLNIELLTSLNGIMSSEPSVIEIIFQDSGPGIPEENLSRIFDPFFSTKESGSGLGLAIVHNIVSQHNGSIDVENSPQGGAVFNLNFPLLPDEKKRIGDHK
jgi:signal transduction histidine kinase